MTPARLASRAFLALGAVAVAAGSYARGDTPCDHYAGLGLTDADLAAWLPAGVSLADWCAPFDALVKGDVPDVLLSAGPCASAEYGDAQWWRCVRFFADGPPLDLPPAIPLPASGWLLLAAVAALVMWRRG